MGGGAKEETQLLPGTCGLGDREELSWLLSLPMGTAVPPEDPPGSGAGEMPPLGLRPWDAEQGFRTRVFQLLRPSVLGPAKGL